MAFSRQLWQQLKNLTADQLISALKRDGWRPDQPSGAIHPFINPVTRKRVTIHRHAKKTYGEKLLQGLLKDIGWNEADFIRLGLAGGKGISAHEEPAEISQGAEISDENRNGQLLMQKTDQPGTDHNQYVWVLLCKHCGNKYGANGSDFHERKCPVCQNGAPGLEIIWDSI